MTDTWETWEVPLSKLDKGIRKYVEILANAGVETFESCEGGPWKNGKGHPFHEPTIRFSGEYAEGFRALSVALYHGLPVSCIRRVYEIIDGEVVGPDWEMVFDKKAKD